VQLSNTFASERSVVATGPSVDLRILMVIHPSLVT